MRRRSLLALPALALCRCAAPPAPPEPAPRPPVHVPRPAPPPGSSPALASAAGPELAGYAEITWAMLRGLNPRTGEASPLLEALAGTDIKLAGYMVPFDDGFTEVTEFLLVPTAGACVHTPPPPANQIVYATLVSGRPGKAEPGESVWVYGRLEIASADSPYGAAGFKLGAVGFERRR